MGRQDYNALIVTLARQYRDEQPGKILDPQWSHAAYNDFLCVQDMVSQTQFHQDLAHEVTGRTWWGTAIGWKR